MVHDHGSDTRFDAVRGQGARRNGRALPRRQPVALVDAIVAVNGAPPADAGWRQFRCMGASALDLCAVAVGRAVLIEFDRIRAGPEFHHGS